MEKLIELLNEYDKTNNYFNKWFRDEYGRLDREYGWSTVSSSCWKVISKEYGFIKWLVDNDKIEVTNIRKLPKKLYINNDGITCVDDMCEDCYYNAYESLLMLLAISDTPIDDLISYLK